MNPVIEAIKARRSVRCYEGRPVPRELIEAILDAGNWAPAQPAHRRFHRAFWAGLWGAGQSGRRQGGTHCL